MAVKETLVKTFGLDLNKLAQSDPDGAIQRSGMQYYFDGVTLHPVMVMRVDNPTDIENDGLRFQSLPASTMTAQVLLENQHKPKLYSMIRFAFNKKLRLSNGFGDS